MLSQACNVIRYVSNVTTNKQDEEDNNVDGEVSYSFLDCWLVPTEYVPVSIIHQSNGERSVRAKEGGMRGAKSEGRGRVAQRLRT